MAVLFKEGPMTISIQDITQYFGLPSSDNLQMLVKWVLLSPSQEFPQKSEQKCAPNGIQLDAGQFAYVTLKSGTGKHVFSAYLFADSATSFRQTNYHRIAQTHYLMYGRNCKGKIPDIFQAYKKADEAVTMEESMPRQQRLEMLAKRSGGAYDKFLGLAKAHELINGFDRNQVAEIRRFWDSRNTLPQVQQQAPQVVPPTQPPFSVPQPAQIASGPLQSPFAAQRPVQAPQAPTTPQMAPQTQVPQVTLQDLFNLMQQLLMANTAQSVPPSVR
jgi:hypothetical protein